MAHFFQLFSANIVIVLSVFVSFCAWSTEGLRPHTLEPTTKNALETLAPKVNYLSAINVIQQRKNALKGAGSYSSDDEIEDLLNISSIIIAYIRDRQSEDLINLPDFHFLTYLEELEVTTLKALQIAQSVHGKDSPVTLKVLVHLNDFSNEWIQEQYAKNYDLVRYARHYRWLKDELSLRDTSPEIDQVREFELYLNLAVLSDFWARSNDVLEYVKKTQVLRANSSLCDDRYLVIAQNYLDLATSEYLKREIIKFFSDSIRLETLNKKVCQAWVYLNKGLVDFSHKSNTDYVLETSKGLNLIIKNEIWSSAFPMLLKRVWNKGSYDSFLHEELLTNLLLHQYIKPNSEESLSLKFIKGHSVYYSGLGLKGALPIFDDFIADLFSHEFLVNRALLAYMYDVSLDVYLEAKNYDLALDIAIKISELDSNNSYQILSVYRHAQDYDGLAKSLGAIEDSYDVRHCSQTVEMALSYESLYMNASNKHYLNKAIELLKSIIISDKCDLTSESKMTLAYLYGHAGIIDKMAELSSASFRLYESELTVFDDFNSYGKEVFVSSYVPTAFLFNCARLAREKTLVEVSSINDSHRDYCRSKSFVAMDMLTIDANSKTIIENMLKVSITSNEITEELAQMSSLEDTVKLQTQSLIVDVVSNIPLKLKQIATNYKLKESLRQRREKLSEHGLVFNKIFDPNSLDVEGLQRDLKPTEAALVVTNGDMEGVTFISVISAKNIAFGLIPITSVDLSALVGRVKKSVDLTAVRFNGQLGPFDYDAAYRIYNEIFGLFEDELADIDSLAIITSGPLQNIPFNLLVTEAPTSSIEQIQWGYQRFNFVSFPTIRALQASRISPKNSAKGLSFLGIGDPALGASKASFRGISVSKKLNIDLSTYYLRGLSSLPKTRSEIEAISQAFDPPPSSKLLLGTEATETAFRSLNVSKYRTIAFATHGLVANEIPGINEPALVLSPEVPFSSLSNGVLTASEIATLDLRADLVILSACNSKGDSRMESDGISGLSTAFLMAGVKSLMVSHWSIESESAAVLSTSMMNVYTNSPNITLTDALKQAIEKVRGNTKWDHPAFWAPFSIVGNDSTF